MKEEKVKGVLDWLTLKGVKDIQNFWDQPITMDSSLKILQ